MDELECKIIIFDLDDTLYKEMDYVRSGNAHVLKLLHELGFHFNEIGNWDVGQVDLIDQLMKDENLPTKLKEELIWSYRLHFPTIKLTQKVSEVVEFFTSKACAVGIITDGRSTTQRLKLSSLGLLKFPLFISDEYHAEKPNSKMFEAVMRQWPEKQYVYIADNPIKDFVSPNAMGWKTIGLIDDGRNVRPDNFNWCNEFGRKDQCPDMWIDNLERLLEIDF